MLSDSEVSTRLPAQDLARARAFYAGKLGLEPVEERPAPPVTLAGPTPGGPGRRAADGCSV
jgi:catechol 2,3-dioxygenase-like lactoylglutathione lyase family enzyme